MTNIEEILEKIRGIESTDEIKVVVDAIENRRKELIDIDLSNFAKQAESLAKLCYRQALLAGLNTFT